MKSSVLEVMEDLTTDRFENVYDNQPKLQLVEKNSSDLATMNKDFE